LGQIVVVFKSRGISVDGTLDKPSRPFIDGTPPGISQRGLVIHSAPALQRFLEAERAAPHDLLSDARVFILFTDALDREILRTQEAAAARLGLKLEEIASTNGVLDLHSRTYRITDVVLYDNSTRELESTK